MLVLRSGALLAGTVSLAVKSSFSLVVLLVEGEENGVSILHV